MSQRRHLHSILLSLLLAETAGGEGNSPPGAGAGAPAHSDNTQCRFEETSIAVWKYVHRKISRK